MEDHLQVNSLKLVSFIGVLLKCKERYNIPIKIKETFYFACFEQKQFSTVCSQKTGLRLNEHFSTTKKNISLKETPCREKKK